jgi:hypothetical protein
MGRSHESHSKLVRERLKQQKRLAKRRRKPIVSATVHMVAKT